MANLLRECATEIKGLMQKRATDTRQPLAEVRLTTRELLAWAKSHKSSSVYAWLKRGKAFNNEAMVELGQRLVTHKLLQRVVVYMEVSPADKTPIRVRMTTSLYGDRTDGGGFRLTGEVMKAPRLCDLLKDTALQELRSLQKRFEMIESVAAAVQMAIDRLE